MFLEELIGAPVHEIPERVLVDPLTELDAGLALVIVCLAVETVMLPTFRASEMRVVSFHPNKYIITSCKDA